VPGYQLYLADCCFCRHGKLWRQPVHTLITRCCPRLWSVGRFTWWRGYCQGIWRSSMKSIPSSWLYVHSF